uniref:Uncharacterized protein n=1 Tax=viral metagenome TaxID=1070528 RepID=A0A6C0JAT4_9ZZZZ
MSISCLTNEMCGNKKIFYNAWCSFTEDGYEYTPNIESTCARDGIDLLYPNCENCDFVDCCAESIEDCCNRSVTRVPSQVPTSIPTTFCPDVSRLYDRKTDDCHFYEVPNESITQYSDDYLLCCSDRKEQCCELQTTFIFSIAGSAILFMIFTMIYFIQNISSSRKISPLPLKRPSLNSQVDPIDIV